MSHHRYILARSDADNVDRVRPGEWRRGRDVDGGGTAITRCPRCCRTSVLGSKHVVNAAGEVTPSYVCPHKGCDFHEHVVLEGWSES